MKLQYNSEDWYVTIDLLRNLKTFEEIEPIWFLIFTTWCKVFKMNTHAIKTLFYNFQMENWKAMHKENSEYAEYTNEQLLDSFIYDLEYSSDRMSFDRLFRNHWKFRRLFDKEMSQKWYKI